jgi:hypothetical protein
MGNTKQEKKEIKKLDKATFVRIDEKFRQYWKCLFLLVFAYIVSWTFWYFVVLGKGKDFAAKHGLDGDVLWFVITMALFQGLLFALDGFVTALLKSPFNQMCFAINKAEGIPDKKKDHMITKATESNEHCKETLKKFGIITIASEIIRSFIRVHKEAEGGRYEDLMIISYLVPIFFAALDIWLIHRELKKIKKELNKYR